MGGRSSKPEQGQHTPPSQEQLKQANDVIKAKGGNALPQDSNWTFKDERSCTDVLFWLIFLIFQGAVLVIAGFGFAYGDPLRLLYGYDFLGNTCGSPNGPNFNKTNLYYPYPIPAGSAVALSTLTVAQMDLSWCIQPFQVMTENQKIVVCGGQYDRTTDFAQFSSIYSDSNQAKQISGINGFLKYCLPNVPMCPCQNSSASWQCCDGSNSQAMDNTYNPPMPMVQKLTAIRTLLGMTVGYEYGFCFIPYPSSSSSFTPRCLPSAPATPTMTAADSQTGESGDTVAQDFTDSMNQILNAQNALYQTSIPSINVADMTSYLSVALNSQVSSAGGAQETFTSLCAELYQNKWVIMGSALLALLCALVYTQLLRYYARELCIVVLALCWTLLGMCTAVLAYKAGIINSRVISQSYASDGTTLTPQIPATVGQADTNRNLLIIATVVVGITFVVFSCVLCVMYQRLMLAAEVISEAGRCLAAMPMVLLFPLAQWIFIAAYFVWFVILFLYLASAGNFNQTSRMFEWNDQIRKCLILHMFAMLWARAMILGGGNLVIAGATAQWFLAPNNQPINEPMLGSTRRMIRYHLGTVYFGSAIIASVQFFRMVIQAYLFGVARGNESNSVVAALKVIGSCCLACLERFFDFINKNAFIQTAIEGTSFCTSASNAFQLLLRNALRLAAISGLSTVFLWIGKIFVAVLTAFICALIIMQGDISNVTQAPVFSVTVITLMAFAIGSAFMDAWEIVIDTLFQCFCMDEEKQAGKTHLSFKQFVDSNKPKPKDLNMIIARAPPQPQQAV